MFFLPIIFALFTACTKDRLTDKIAGSNESSISATINKNTLLQLVNNLRKSGCQCGDTYYDPATAVVWNNLLEAAAYAHSNDMFQNNYLSHTAPDGSNGGVRIERAGYKWIAYGENIASGFKTEQEVIKGWLSSPNHCKNIMNKAYKEMGVGRVGNYWTQEMAVK